MGDDPAAAGGLLGLGFGFSILSAAELLYFFLVRWFYYWYRAKVKSRAVDQILAAYQQEQSRLRVRNWLIDLIIDDTIIWRFHFTKRCLFTTRDPLVAIPSSIDTRQTSEYVINQPTCELIIPVELEVNRIKQREPVVRMASVNKEEPLTRKRLDEFSVDPSKTSM